MKLFSIALIYLGFLAFVAWIVTISGSFWFLLLLLLSPSVEYKDND